MNNLQWLYDTDDTFRDAVRANAADWLGSTSTNFADAWLREMHRSDYEDLTGQHIDGPCLVPNRDEQVDMVTDLVVANAEERKLETLRKLAEKYRADAIAAQDERDAYRDLCGRMRKLANEMMVMEVD